jgi:hypothetical protein
MSNTYRHVDYGWGPGNPDFDEWFPNIKSKKHQCRDRRSKKLDRKFYKDMKMPTREIIRKMDEIDKRECLTCLSD